MNTYHFVYGQLIQAIGKSTNMLGSSEFSSVSTVSVIALTTPAFCYPPTEGLGTNKNTIELDWYSITQAYQTGGVPIIQYHIYYD